MKGTEEMLVKESCCDKIPFINDSASSMHHLTCFFPGLLALAAENDACGTAERDLKRAYQLA